MPNSGQNLEDALHPRMAGSTEGMTLQVLAQIRDSLTAQSRDVRTLTEGVTDVRERVIRLEENNRRLGEVETDLKVVKDRVDILWTDKDRRDGAIGLLGVARVWGPLIFSAIAALWLLGRSFGITPAPPVQPVRLEAASNPHDHRIEGTVGGKP